MTQSCIYSGAMYWNHADGKLEGFDSSTFNPPDGAAFQFNNASCTSLYSNSSTDLGVLGGFSYGDIVITTLLFFLLMCGVSINYFVHFRKIRIKN